MSAKLEKIARQYRIDPSKLPPVDGNSMTVNISGRPFTPAAPAPVVPQAPQPGDKERLRAEAQAAMRRLKDYERAERDRILASRSSR